MSILPKGVNGALDLEHLNPPWTRKQAIFALEYLSDRNRDATAAAIRAGYSAKSAKNQAYRMMTHDDYAHVRKFIELKAQDMMEALGIKGELVLKEIAAIAFCNLLNFLKIDERGQPHFDFKDAVLEDMASIASIGFVQLEPVSWGAGDGQMIQREVTKVQVRLHDKMRALEVLMKHLGLDKEHVDPTKNKNEDINLDEVARRVAFLINPHFINMKN